jgi:hypothetical protein
MSGADIQQLETYRCDGCGTEYHVAAGEEPTVVCPDCNQVATPRGDPKARREYQVGHAKYVEARRRLTEALDRFEAGDTTLARGGFNDAATELQTSVDHFRTAASQATSEAVTEPCERARDKATCLWQAVEWLSGATYAAEQGDQSQATRYKNDATQRLQASREYGELADPENLSA